MSKKRIPLPKIGSDSCFIDTHCHLDMPDYADDLGEVLTRAEENGIRQVITIGIDGASSRRAVELARDHAMLWATVGVHPHDAGRVESKDLEDIEALIETCRDRIVAYGEIGLDYVKLRADSRSQRKALRSQIAIAGNHRLPLVIHDREAHEDILRILRETGPLLDGGVMHCFSGDAELARQVVDLGLHISLPGIVTFKNAEAMQQVARQVPLDRLLIETDGPFLAPDPYRGKRNEPLFLLYTAQKIAELRDIALEELADHSTANACRLFGIPHDQESQP